MLNIARTKTSIRALERRAEFLEKRIENSDRDLSYDKSELGSLRQAIFVLQGVLDNPMIWGEFGGKNGQKD